MKKLIACLLIVVTLLGLASCGGLTTKTLTKDGVSMTLPGDFVISEGFGDYSFCFETNDCNIAVMIETFDEWKELGVDPESYNVAQYADLIFEDLDAGYPFAEGNMVCVETDEEVDGDVFSSLLAARKMDGAFVCFHFTTLKEDYSSMKSKFIEWGNNATYSK